METCFSSLGGCSGTWCSLLARHTRLCSEALQDFSADCLPLTSLFVTTGFCNSRFLPYDSQVMGESPPSPKALPSVSLSSVSRRGSASCGWGGESPEVPRGQWDNGEAVTDETLCLPQSTLHPPLSSWLVSGAQPWLVGPQGSWSDPMALTSQCRGQRVRVLTALSSSLSGGCGAQVPSSPAALQ